MTAGVEAITLGKLSERCVIVALHASAKAEKHLLIGSSFLSRVKTGSILVDAAIGSLASMYTKPSHPKKYCFAFQTSWLVIILPGIRM